MGTTADFAKLRSTKTPKVGEWNIDYKTALAKAKNEGKFIVTLWSNGDACGYCVAAEKCLMQAAFTGWMKKQNAYFVFQHSGDKDKGQTVKDWVYKGTGLKYYPGFRISLYDAKGKLVVDQSVDGNTARGKKTGANGAKAIVAYLEKVFAKAPAKPEPAPEPTPAPVADKYAVRFNEKLTVAQINKVLDALDKNEGYCPCQVKYDGSKCHCEDFVKNKGFGEPCICKIFVKQPVVAAKKAAARGCKKTTKK